MSKLQTFVIHSEMDREIVERIALLALNANRRAVIVDYTAILEAEGHLGVGRLFRVFRQYGSGWLSPETIYNTAHAIWGSLVEVKTVSGQSSSDNIYGNPYLEFRFKVHDHYPTPGVFENYLEFGLKL